MNYYFSPQNGCFQDLASLMRCPESLSFNHLSLLCQHKTRIEGMEKECFEPHASVIVDVPVIQSDV
jgi:hypothetical protein